MEESYEDGPEEIDNITDLMYDYEDWISDIFHKSILDIYHSYKWLSDIEIYSMHIY